MAIAIANRIAQKSIIFFSPDVEWVVSFSLAMILPLYSIQFLNAASLKPDLTDIKSDLNDIKKMSSSGMVRSAGKANEAAPKVVSRIKLASDVFNTFIVWNDPYLPKIGLSVKNALIEHLKAKRGIWEETVSQQGLKRVEVIKNELDSLPPNFSVRDLKNEKDYFPICNFIVLQYPESVDLPDEVFFGWGYFKNSQNEHVFWSNDSHLVSFFINYNKALRDDTITFEYS